MLKNLFNKKLFYSTFSLLAVPGLAFGFSLKTSTLGAVITEVTQIIDLIIPILISLAFVMFFWGVSKFILNSDKPDEIKNGRNYMIWGVVALFILLTYKAIIGLVVTDLETAPGGGVGNTNPRGILLPEGR